MVGVGGIGMSALAQMYRTQGHHVRGSDREASLVTALLAEAGIDVLIGHRAEHVADDVNMLVYSDAVPADNLERVRARELGILEYSYFEALGEATKEGISIVVAGTHGKTTTTAMLAKILIDTGKEPTVIAGSILSDRGSNFVSGKSGLFVIEGCEYRRHFLKLHPNILIINNIELDHTDYYKDLTDMEDAFREVVLRVGETGTIVTNTESSAVKRVITKARARVVPYQEVTIPTLKVPGTFNVENACAAKAAAFAFDPDLHEAEIDRSLATFSGAWRRFEYKGTTKSGAAVYDDYAHHPTAIRGTLEMVRAEFPDKKIAVVFHPHLYSRTHDFMEDFADALALADEVLLAPIYAAREEPIEGVTSAALAEKIVLRGTPAHTFDSLDAIEQHLNFSHSPLTDSHLVLTMGAGDVYKLADRLVQAL